MDASIENEADDELLLAALRARDSAAFARLVERECGKLLAVCRRLLPVEQDAEDAVQETFLSAYKALPNFDGRSKLSTWMHRIAVNACLMKLRRRRQESSFVAPLSGFDEDGYRLEPVAPWSFSPAELAERAELRECVRRSIAELPDIHRAVLILRDIEQWSGAETAEALGVDENVVKVRLHRARLALRDSLERQGGGKK
jgi:RNA polymerase sigma-70 factor (ECF subfamily)